MILQHIKMYIIEQITISSKNLPKQPYQPNSTCHQDLQFSDNPNKMFSINEMFFLYILPPTKAKQVNNQF